MAPSIGTWLPSRLNGGKRASRGRSILMSIKKYVRENSSRTEGSMYTLMLRGRHHFPISDSRAREGLLQLRNPSKKGWRSPEHHPLSQMDHPMFSWKFWISLLANFWLCGTGYYYFQHSSLPFHNPEPWFLSLLPPDAVSPTGQPLLVALDCIKACYNSTLELV